MTTVTENEQVTEEYKEHKKKEYLEAIAAWKPSMAEQELFNDEDYWEQSAEEAVKKLDKKLGWNNGGGNDDGSGKGGGGGSTSSSDDGSNENPNMADKLLAIVKQQIVELFEDEYHTPFAAVKIKGHIETVPMPVTHNSNGRFKRWMSKIYYDTTKKLMSNTDALTVVYNHLSGEATFGDNTHKTLDLRVSYGPKNNADNNKTIYYDLTNKDCEVIAITEDAWSVMKSNEVPTMFRRYQTQQPQVYPISTGKYPPDIFDQFIDILNVRKDGNDRLLLKCYIISLFMPKIAKAILMLHGPEGAAKSACEKLVKYLVDPCSTILLPLRRKEDDLILQFVQNYLIYYDNVSEIPDWISDYFCMVATGFSFSKRMLYFDDEQIVFQLIRPIGFNGINLAANKADLLDRGLSIELEEIEPEAVLKFEDEILPKFNEMKPRLLSYIFDIVSKVLKKKSEGGIELKTRSRMADWEEYCEIIARCMGYKDMEFINAYRENRKTKTQVIIDETPVAQAIVNLMMYDKLSKVANGNGSGSWSGGLSKELVWTGSPSQLLGLLKPIASDDLKIDIARNELWPKAPHILSRRLNQVKSSLKGVGISINKSQNHNTKLRTISIVKSAPSPTSPVEVGKVATPATPASPTKKSCSNESKNGDATGDATCSEGDPTDKVATPNNDENHAQNIEGDARDARDATCTTFTGNPSLRETTQRLKNINEAYQKYKME